MNELEIREMFRFAHGIRELVAILIHGVIQIHSLRVHKKISSIFFFYESELLDSELVKLSEKARGEDVNGKRTRVQTATSNPFPDNRLVFSKDYYWLL